MSDIWKEFLVFMTGKAWIVQTFFIILFTLILKYIFIRLYNKIKPKLEKTHLFWDEALLEALYRPIKVLIWVVGISFAAEIVGAKSETDILFKAIDSLRSIFFVFVFGWTLLRFIKNIEVDFIKHKKKRNKPYDRTTVRALCQILRITVIVTSSLICLQTIGVSISAVLAFGGVGGLAVAWAAKDLLSNFFGGLMLFLDRPFVVGDWISSPDKEIEGTVEHIGWRLTRIRTFSKRPLFVPNGTFSTISVENPSRMTNRRIYTHVGLRYQDATKMDVILKDVEKMLRNHIEIDQDQTLMVNLDQFGPSSLNFFVYTFTKTTDWVKFQAIQQDVFLQIINIVDSHGAECAFPTTTLNLPKPLIVNSET